MNRASFAVAALPSNTLSMKPGDARALGKEITTVKRLHAAVTKNARDSRDKAIQIGEVLTGIKESLQHGDWLPWLTANLSEITPRTAQNYMRVWTNRSLFKNETGSYLVENYTAALAAVSKPKDKAPKPEEVEDQSGSHAANQSSEQSRKRELLRRLGRDFAAGLEHEEVKVLDLVASRLPDWRRGLLEATRRELSGTTAPKSNAQPQLLAA